MWAFVKLLKGNLLIVIAPIRLMIGLVAAFLVMGCQTVPIKTYPVHGETTQALLFDLKDNPVGPKDSWGHRGAAMTLCRVRLELKGEKQMRWNADGCHCRAQLQKIQLHKEVEITMPKWVQEPQASRDCKNKWERFLRATRYHEEGHVKICHSGVENIQRHLDNVSSAAVEKRGADCDTVCETAWKELKWEIERVYKKHFEELQQRQVDYDEKTRHGQTQGGVLETCYPHG